MADKKAISIHALLAESDLIWRYLTPKALKFLSTLSLRRATYVCQSPCCGWFYFYPRSPCGERLGPLIFSVQPRKISIHALLAESDNVIIHSAHPHKSFLSTLSLRRATLDGRFKL